jgi:hypothetical protein
VATLAQLRWLWKKVKKQVINRRRSNRIAFLLFSGQFLLPIQLPLNVKRISYKWEE